MPLSEVEVTPQLVSFMKHVVAVLEEADEDTTFDYDDAIKADDGWGGRLDDGRFCFVFFPSDRDERWTIALHVDEVRALAHGKRKTVHVTRADDVAHRHPDAHAAKRSHDATVGARLLEALLKKELVVLAADADPKEIGEALEKILVEVLDDPTLDDEERGFAIAEVLGGMHGVEEMLVTDEALVAVARALDR